MEIIKGRIQTAKKVVIYGPEGIGKTTFASKFPDPIFIDTEGSTKDMDVARLKKPTSWQMLLQQIQDIKLEPSVCKTLVIDTMDWAEQLCVEHICAKHQKTGIEDFGYGNGYVYVKEELGRLLNQLEDLVELGINIVLSAHAQIRKFEQPDELGAYDRYELKLGKKTSSQTSPLVKEWADMVLFANYKTYSIATDDKGKKHKAQGGTRVMYTTHHPCWDAKNRYSLPVEMPFDYAGIAHLFNFQITKSVEESKPVSEKKQVEVPDHQKQPDPPKQEYKTVEIKDDPPKQDTEPKFRPIPPNEKIPKALRDLMIANKVDEWDIQNVVAARGYFTSDVPIEKYDDSKPGFVMGVLVGAWPQVFDMIKKMRDEQETPFD